MTERGLKNINVFYSTFINVFFKFLSRFFTFLTFLIFFLERFFYIYEFNQSTCISAFILTYLERLVEANDVRMPKWSHDARLAVQVRSDVLVLDLSRVDDLYRHLRTHARTRSANGFPLLAMHFRHPSRVHYSIPGWKLTFSTNLFPPQSASTQRTSSSDSVYWIGLILLNGFLRFSLFSSLFLSLGRAAA